MTENMAKVAAQREALQVLLSSTLDSLELHGTVEPVIEAVLSAEQAEVRSAVPHSLTCPALHHNPHQQVAGRGLG